MSKNRDWPAFAHSCICMCIYVCVNMSVGCTMRPQPAAHGFAATTLARVASVPAGWQGRGDPLCGSPRRRGASCTSFVTPFGPLCLWLPRSGPTWQLAVQTDICSLQPPGEQRKQQPTEPALLLSALHTLLHTARTVTIFRCSRKKRLSIHLSMVVCFFLNCIN